MRQSRLLLILSIVLVLLSIPFIAMQFTEEVQWSPLDFTVMGILLGLTGISIDFVIRRNATLARKLGYCSLVILGFIAVWAELAVGIL